MIMTVRLLALVFAAVVPHGHKHHRHKPKPPPAPPMSRAVASWYDDSGMTASGRHYLYGFASLMFGSDWGHRIRFCYRGCAIGQLDDHGPYVSGRGFDLNPTLKAAIGCPDLCAVSYGPPLPPKPPKPPGARLTFRR